MPYIFVVDGKSAIVEAKKPYELRTSITSQPGYKDLVTRGEAHGLVVGETVNRDDSELAFFVGKELYRDRHIFQGLTVTLTEQATYDEEGVAEDIFAELELLLRQQGLEPKIQKGIVISQFD